ncbi:homoserine kinase type II [Allocatelliglobosispora scoriae]|uniref:Homoserine kinase type II n=2 Tax=Allocatelliglobosispora scoriae TaxID=643052 RepID=A0A841BP42_9ACTN|nr:homoserine kinase type II [Allocatelliglobosispora scoriae]
MTSVTFMVTVGSDRYVAKVVPTALQSQFEAGLSMAEALSRVNIDAGSPVRTVDGSLTTPLVGGALGLLRFVGGRPLDACDQLDQQWWGDRLGAAHRKLAGFTHPGTPRWHWVRPDAEHLDLEPWLRPAVGSAVAELTRLQVTDRLSVGALHGDPAAEAFLLDPATGRIGIIDWGSCVTGPHVYDLASAVMYAGGIHRAAALIEAYSAAGPVPRGEIEAALPTLLRFRWAVQADYFAQRITTRDTTGIADPAENIKGLHDARDALRTG